MGSVVFTSGFRPEYGGLAPWPEAFDALGFPHQLDGASTVVPGLFFMGVHFLRKRKSSLLMGVGEDAAVVSDAIEAQLRP
jgi:putative flavoprotein involved in K+ transport